MNGVFNGTITYKSYKRSIPRCQLWLPEGIPVLGWTCQISRWWYCTSSAPQLASGRPASLCSSHHSVLPPEGSERNLRYPMRENSEPTSCNSSSKSFLRNYTVQNFKMQKWNSDHGCGECSPALLNGTFLLILPDWMAKGWHVVTKLVSDLQTMHICKTGDKQVSSFGK